MNLKIKKSFEAIKDTHEDEIADVFIRLFDYCGGMNIPIGDHIAAKISYNSTRPYKHGKTLKSSYESI